MPIQPCVYVVDDDEAVRDSLRLLLEDHAFVVRDFASCEAFFAGAGEPDGGCLVLDLHFPGMDGLALLRRLAEAPRRLPVIVITGRSDAATVSAVRAAGAIALIEKPFEHDLLLATIDRALAGA